MEKRPEFFLRKLPQRKLAKLSQLIQNEYEWLTLFFGSTAIENEEGEILLTHISETLEWEQFEGRFWPLLSEQLKLEMVEIGNKVKAINETKKPVRDLKIRVTGWKISFFSQEKSANSSAAAANYYFQKKNSLYSVSRKILFIEDALKQKEFSKLSKKWHFQKVFNKVKDPVLIEQMYSEIVSIYYKEVERFFDKINHLVQEKTTVIQTTLQKEMEARTKLGKWIDSRSQEKKTV